MLQRAIRQTNEYALIYNDGTHPQEGGVGLIVCKCSLCRLLVSISFGRGGGVRFGCGNHGNWSSLGAGSGKVSSFHLRLDVDSTRLGIGGR